MMKRVLISWRLIEYLVRVEKSVINREPIGSCGFMDYMTPTKPQKESIKVKNVFPEKAGYSG